MLQEPAIQGGNKAELIEGMTLTIKVIFLQLRFVPRKQYKVINSYVVLEHPKILSFWIHGGFYLVPYIAKET